MRCVTCWRPCKKRRSRRRMGWEQPVFEFNKITDSAVAKPFTMPIFTSYPLLEEKRLELLRQGESSRRRNTSRSRINCARPGPNDRSELRGQRTEDRGQRTEDRGWGTSLDFFPSPLGHRVAAFVEFDVVDEG